MMIMTLPWHWLGLNGQWRRVAQFDYTDPAIAWWTPYMVACLIGGALLVASATLFIWNLAGFHRPARIAAIIPTVRYAVALHPPVRVPASLNGFTLWNSLVLMLMAAAYTYPIVQSFIINPPKALVHRADNPN
jgi:cytochrome c oxidase subunit 1